MSLSSTSTIKQQISSQLGPKAPAYFEPLASFVTGKISRPEFEDSLKAVLDAPNLSEQRRPRRSLSNDIAQFNCTMHS